MRKFTLSLLAAAMSFCGLNAMAQDNNYGFGPDVPTPYNCWSFNGDDYFLASDIEGMPELQPLKVLSGGIEFTYADDAGIVIIDGPTADNPAIRVPKEAALRATLGLEEMTNNYTLMMDIYEPYFGGFNALIQTYHPDNSDDADIFIHGNEIGVGVMGYSWNVIREHRWMRIVFVNNNGTLSLYLDGDYLREKADKRWNIQPEGFNFFCDNDGEKKETYVAKLAIWQKPLTAEEVKAMGKVNIGAFLQAEKTTRMILDNLDFSVNVESTIPVTFDFPEWIEAVDTAFVNGKKDYTFRCKPFEETGKRSGVVVVTTEEFDPVEVIVNQYNPGGEMPQPDGVWTFDDEANPMAGTGTARLRPAYNTLDGVVVTEGIEEADIVVLEKGPKADNGAIGVSAFSNLLLEHGQESETLTNYTIMIDIRPETLNGCNSLFLNSTDVTSDGSLFITDLSIGIQESGLGYNGILTEGQWERIAWVVRDNYIRTFINGKLVGASTSGNAKRWELHSQALFFGDDNGERLWNDVAEIRFWATDLADAHIAELGEVEQDASDVVIDPVPDPIGVWHFNNPDNWLEGEGEASLSYAIRGEGGPVVVETAAEAGIEQTDAPQNDKGAITVPIDSYLRINHAQDQNPVASWTMLFDIRTKHMNGYQSLFQTHINNDSDALLFFKNNAIGLNGSGLGYNGEFEPLTWYRIVVAVDNGLIQIYCNGIKVSQSAVASILWKLTNGTLLFCDNDGEEGVIDIAELRLWNAFLTPSAIAQLGNAPGQDVTAIDGVKANAVVKGIYDLFGRKYNHTNLQPGMYIIDGQKSVVK